MRRKPEWQAPYQLGRKAAQLRREWSLGHSFLIALVTVLLTLSDSALQPAAPGWLAPLNPEAWGNLTIRQDGEISAKYITAHLGQSPLEIVPYSLFRYGPKVGPIDEIARDYSFKTRREVLGAINGGFFDLKTGLPLGFLLRDGALEFFNMPQGVRRSMVGFTRPQKNGKGISILIDSPQQMPKVFLNRLDPRSGKVLAALPVHHVNVPGGRDALTLYTHHFAQSLRPSSKGIYFKARQRIPPTESRLPVYEIIEQWDGKTPQLSLSPQDLVIAFFGDSLPFAKQVPKGSLVQARWTPPEEWRRRNVVHGLLAGPRLLEKGKVRITAKEENLAFLKSRDRVALGVKPDGEAVLLWLHHTRRKANLSFDEVAQALLKLGVSDAIALDGGNSRAILAVAREAYRKDLYLYTGRPVANALLVSLPL